MPRKLCHGEKSPCPIAHALDVLGDKWTLLVIRDMLFMNLHEFREFLASPEGIATNILSGRLQKLTAMGLVDSLGHPSDKKRKFYYLTPAGKDLIHPMTELARWADRNLVSVDLPEDIARELRRDAENMKKRTLGTLAQWEEKHLDKPATLGAQS